MSYSYSNQLFIVQLKFLSGSTVISPLLEPGAVRLDQYPSRLAINFSTAFQKKMIDVGDYAKVLQYLSNGPYTIEEITLSFDASQQTALLHHPEFELTFQYIRKEQSDGIWVAIPVLGIETFCKDGEDTDELLRQVIRLEFARKDRFRSFEKIISTLWYEEIGLSEESIELNFYTPSELHQLKNDNKQEILPIVARKLTIFKPVTYGLDNEINQVVRILKSGFQRNILMVGPSGVGKTALVWEIAYRKKKLGLKFDIWETTASTLIKELTRETGWQDNLAYLCKELARKGDILFIRNFLELFEVGKYEGNSVSIAEYLKPFITRGEVNVITECTDEEYARIDLRSPNYLPVFQTVRLEEPKENLEDIIMKKVKDIARSLDVEIHPEAIKETIRLNRRYTPYSGFPGKPIRFLESILLTQKSLDRRASREERKKVRETITRSQVIRYFCEETGMPPFMVDPETPLEPEKILDHFQKNIFGQEMAVQTVVGLLSAVKTALTRQGKPIASCLLVGPTGVGKTELAKVLAQFMFGSRERMIRFDMSEYSNPWSVQRLTGESFHRDGILTSAVRREPFSVLLFDEIEKAHRLFYDLLLQILGEGRLTDSRGRLVNFCSTIIIMTSNIGAKNLQSDRIGWNNELDVDMVTDHFMSAVQKHFRPELFNRIDKLIPFQPLSKRVMRFVVEREVKLFQKEKGFTIATSSLTSTMKCWTIWRKPDIIRSMEHASFSVPSGKN